MRKPWSFIIAAVLLLLGAATPLLAAPGDAGAPAGRPPHAGPPDHAAGGPAQPPPEGLPDDWADAPAPPPPGAPEERFEVTRADTGEEPEPRKEEGDESTERLVVRFKGAADLRAVSKDWRQRGRAVEKRLKEKANRSQSRVKKLVKARKAKAESFWISDVMVIEDADPALREELAARPEVAEVRPERRYHLPEPIDMEQVAAAVATAAGTPWGITKVGADRAWDQGVLGGGVVVASIDSGVDHTHPAIATQYRGHLGNGVFDHDYNWYDASGTCPDDEPCDLHGHGTHTMGTIVGGDGPGPYTPDIGVAPAARWISAGCGPLFCDESQILAAGEWVLAPFGDADHPADPAKRPHVVNNSWGGDPGDPTMLDMVRSWRAAGIVPVFSAGNTGPACSTAGSPADYPESFTVGATDPDDVIADFSSRGPSLDGAPKPAVSAPGVDVLSAVPGAEYAELSGTSMAAPHVTGAIALVLSAAPALRPDIDAVTGALTRTAVDRADPTCGGDSDGDPNNVYGEGRIDAAAAVGDVATGGRLTGRITDTDGQPVAGARITATADDVELASFTRADGAYTLLLPGGTYEIATQPFGYGRASTSTTIADAGGATADLVLTATPRRTVSGTVRRNENGEPLAGVRVQALATPVPVTATGADGRYSFSLPPGTYAIRATSGGCAGPRTVQVTVESRAVEADLALTAKTDRYGHVCSTSTTEWVRTTRPTGLTGDSAYGRFSLPISYEHYGQRYRHLYVSTDGVLSFLDPEHTSWPGSIPWEDTPNAAVYPLWDDLEVGDGARITYEHLGWWSTRRTVVTFEDVRPVGGGEPVTFQVHVWANGTVDLLYRDMAGVEEGAWATIGIEDHTGTDALQFSSRERTALSNTAWRYERRATATFSGTVVDANDGGRVAGATVIAEPGGRTATTDRYGRYRLGVLPGTYRLTAGAPRYQPATSATVTARDGRTTTVPELATTAPVASVSPTSLGVTTTRGQTASTTVRLANTGSAPMSWALHPRTAATGAVPLQRLATDPVGDGSQGVDVEHLSGSSDGTTLSVSVELSATTDASAALGAVLLDVDQDPATGADPVSNGGLEAHDLGVDHTVLLTPLQWGDEVEIVDEDGELVGTAPGVLEGRTMRFDAPLSLLGGDDGNVDLVTMVGSFMGASDWVPDAGHATLEAGAVPDWLVASTSSGVLAPGASVDVRIDAGSATLPAGSHQAELRLVTDAPRRAKVVVPVRLTVR